MGRFLIIGLAIAGAVVVAEVATSGGGSESARPAPPLPTEVLVGPKVTALFLPDAGRHLGQTTFPFSKDRPEIAPGLTVLRCALVRQAGRDVSIVAMSPFYRRVLEVVNGAQMLRII